MDKETSDRVSSIAGRWLHEMKRLPNAEMFAVNREELSALAGTAMGQDQTPGLRSSIGSAGIHPAPEEFTSSELELDPVLHYFHYSHLPPQLQKTSKAFFLLAKHVVDTVPRNPERTVALRKLLEAKDAAVRANLPAREKRALASEPVQTLGEPREIGDADEDRDGPVPFGG